MLLTGKIYDIINRLMRKIEKYERYVLIVKIEKYERLKNEIEKE